MLKRLKMHLKRLLLLLFVTGVAYGTLPAFSEDSQGTMESPPGSLKTMTIHKGNAVIDGKSEFQWEILKPEIFGSEVANVSVKALWNKKTLYLYVMVEDLTQDGNDCVKLLLCDDYGKTYENIDVFSFYRDGVAEDDTDFIITENERGYSVEAVVTLSENPIPGDLIAIDFVVTNTSATKELNWNNSGSTGLWSFGTGFFGKELKAAYSLYGTPTIDGEMEAVWADAIEITTNTWVHGIVGPTAKVRTLWDEKKLYIYAQVIGKPESLWEKDSVEIFLDRRNDKANTIEQDDARYLISFDNNLGYGKGARAKHIQSYVKAVENGYAIEASIAWDQVTAAQDSLVGFDIQVNHDYNRDGARDNAVTWNDSTGFSDISTEGYGVLRLVKAESLVFTDIYSIAWAKDQIEFLGSRQIIMASAGQRFEPTKEVTRADFLHYLINTLSLTAQTGSNFDDVPPDAGYASAIAVARTLGITNGVGNNQFLPLAGITRQDMMTLVVRALNVAGKSFESADEADIQGFTDASLVSDYAVQSVAALVKNGIIQGTGNRLNPRFNLTRAEAAVLLYRVYQMP